MEQAAVDIAYRTFRRIVGGDVLDARAKQLGYEVGPQRRGELRIHNDWHVSYHRSTYRGRPCLYIMWSAMNQIFQQEQRR